MKQPTVVRSIDFATPPVPGTVLMVEGQRYEVIRTEPHRRRDGSRTTLIVWRTHCAETGHPFELKTGLVAKSINRRCPEHKAPGRPVSSAGRRRRHDWLRRSNNEAKKRR